MRIVYLDVYRECQRGGTTQHTANIFSIGHRASIGESREPRQMVDLDNDTDGAWISAAIRRPRLMNALSNFSVSSFLKTLSTGGEPGASGGFGILVLAQLLSVPSSANNTLLVRENGSDTAGHLLRANSSADLQFLCGISGAGVYAPTRRLVASDVGRVHLFAGQLDAAAVRLIVDRQEQGAGTAASASGYAVYAGPMTLGNWHLNLTTPASVFAILAWLAFHGTPTSAQLADLFDRARLHGDLPTAMQGATITHRHSVRDQLLGVSNPAGRKSYGAGPLSISAGYQSAAGAGLGGHVAGFAGACVVTLSTNSATGTLVWRAAGSTGYVVDLFGQTVRLTAYGSTTAQFTAPIQIYGAPCLIAWRYNGTTLSLWMGRAQVGSAALAGYVVSSAAMKVGLAGTGTFDFYEVGGANYSPSDAEMQALFDAFDASGRLPRPAWMTDAWSVQDESLVAVPSTLTNRLGGSGGSLTSSGTLEQRVYTATAPAAPLALTDTITQAAADVMARQGTPTVVTIDPSRDGRRTLGVQGSSSAAYLTTTGTGPALGSLASGICVAWWGRIDSQSVTGGNRFPLQQGNASTVGVTLQTNVTNSNIYWRLGTGGALVDRSFAISASDVGLPQLFVGWLDPVTGTSRVFWRGAEQGTGVAVSAYVPSTAPLTIGTGLDPAGYSTFGAAVFSNITLAEILQLYADLDRTGRMPTVQGKTLWSVDLAQDILAAGETVPAQVLDRIGSNHLTRVNDNISVSGAFTGLRNFSGTNRAVRTAGIGSVSNQSFFAQVALRVDAQTGIASRFRMPYSRIVSSPRAGWDFITTALNSGVISFEITLSGGGAAGASTYSLASALGNTYVFTGVYDAAAQTVALYVDGVIAGSPQPAASYLAPASSVLEYIGSDGGNAASYWADGLTVFAVGGGQNAVPVVGELAAQAATFKATGTLPAIAGMTSVVNCKSALSSGTVPARISDSLGGEPFTSGFANVQVAQRTERTWGYETSPIMYGLKTDSDSDYYEIPGANALFSGSTSSYWVSALITVLSQANTRVRTIVSRCYVSGRGFELRVLGSNSQAYLYHCNAANTGVASPIVTINAADVGKLLLITAGFDAIAGKLRTWIRRVEQGTGSAVVGYTPPTSADPLRLLRAQSWAGQYCQDLVLWGTAMGLSVPTLSQVQAHHDAVMAAERMVEIPGLTSTLVDCRAEVLAAGGALPSSLRDLKGGPSFGRVGAPAVVPQYSRGWAW